MLLLLIKSNPKFAHTGKYALYGNPPRWHLLHADKPAPKGAPVASVPHAAGQHMPAMLSTEEVEALKYKGDKVQSNHEMKNWNEKHIPELLGHAANGDATAILGMSYGTNTHGKLKAKLANVLLEKMGSKHVVTPGQKQGEHEAVQQVVKEASAPVEQPTQDTSEPEPALAPEQAASGLAMPAFVEGKTVAGVVEYYQKIGQKVLDLAAAGDVAGLKSLPTSKGKTWQGKTENSKLLLDLHAKALEQANGGAAAADDAKDKAIQAAVDHLKEDAKQPDLPDVEKKEDAELVAKLEAAQEPAHVGKGPRLIIPKKKSNPAPATDDKSALESFNWDALKPPKDTKNYATYSKKIDALKVAVLSGDIAAIEAMNWGKNSYNKKLEKVAQTALAALKEGVAPATPPSVEAQTQQAAVSEPDTGPHEGDVKQGADGTLVFKNGRWHKQGDKPAATSLHTVELHHTEDGHNKFWAVTVDGSAVVTHYGKIGTKGAKTSKLFGSPAEAAAYAGKITDEKYKKGYKFHKSTGSADASAQPAPTPAAAPAPTAIEAMDNWKQTGPQGGSNPGGRFKDPDGVEWYCKFPADEDTAKAEVLAAKLYAALGISGQDAKLITKGGKVGIASKWTSVSKASSPAALAKVDGVASGFGADAWLGNWDVVGLAYDNLQIGADGKAHRVDAGGSLMYRAQGGKKAFGNIVTEIDSLRDPKINAQAAAVFGGMTDADITASVAKVLALPDASIRAICYQHGPGSEADRKALAETLIARKNDLAAKFPKAAKPKKKRLDPNNLPVDPSQLPKRHDFSNWNGPGKGLSSKPHVNAANAAVEQEAFELAKTGNLTKLKDFHFHEIDKDTGTATGKLIPIKNHPSKHVVQFHADLVQLLDEIANPPEPLKIFAETDVPTLDALAAAFPPKPFGTTVDSVKSNEKLGFWVVLGGASGVEKFKPKKVMDFTKAAIDAAYQKYNEAKPLAKHFINSVQASGSYNDLFRNGKEHDGHGNKLVDVAKAALENATSQPEGTSVYRWQNMSDDMVKKIMSAPDGTVFQATGPMCTSYSPTATAGFGQHRVTIRYAKGAKAVESFGSGAFKGEKEVTTLPNSRFVILSKKMVPNEKNPGKQRLELEVLMLPPDLGIAP